MVLNENVEISVQKGMSFRFRDADNEIIYKCSSISEKEKVEVNGRLISEAKNFTTRSNHTFFVDGVEYLIQLVAKSLLKGPYECSLSKNRVVLKTYKLKYIRATRRFWVRRFSSILGIAVGMAYIANFITLGVVVVIIAIGSLVIGVWNKGHWACEVAS